MSLNIFSFVHSVTAGFQTVRFFSLSRSPFVIRHCKYSINIRNRQRIKIYECKSTSIIVGKASTHHELCIFSPPAIMSIWSYETQVSNKIIIIKKHKKRRKIIRPPPPQKKRVTNHPHPRTSHTYTPTH